MVIKEFLVSLGFQVDKKQLGNFQSGLKKATISAGIMAAAVSGAFVLVTKFTKSTAESYEKLGFLSSRVNASVKDLKELSFVASLNQSSAESLTSSFDRFNKIIGEASLGIGRGAMIFKQLHLDAKNANGTLKTTTQLFEEVGKKITGLSGQQQVATLSRLGIDPDLIKTMTTDTSEIRAEFSKLYADVGVDAEDASKKSIDFVDSVTRTKFVMTTLKDAIAISIMPKIQEGIDRFRKFMVNNSKKIIDTITPIIKIFIRLQAGIVLAIDRILRIGSKLLDWFTDINTKTKGWAGYILAAVAAWKLLNLAFLASPTGKLILLFTTLALLIDDLMTFNEGGESAIKWSKKWGKALEYVAWAIGIVTAGVYAAKIAMAVWSVAVKFLTGLLKTFQIVLVATEAIMSANPIGLLIIAVTSLIGLTVILVKNWEKVKLFFTDFFNFFKGEIEQFQSQVKRAGNIVSGIFSGKKNINLSGNITPSAQSASNLVKNNSNINQTTQITVNGSNSPESTAKLVGKEQSRVNSDLFRYSYGILR